MSRLHRSSAARLVPGILTLALAGCGGDAPAGTAGADAGSALDAADRMVELTPEPVYRVGGFDAPEWATFGGVSSLRFDGQGHLYVLDGQAKQITVIGLDGNPVRTVGKAGEGPGELSGPIGLAVSPDGRLATFDFSQRGFTVYDAAGEYEGTIPVDISELGFPGSAFTYHPDGGLVSTIGGQFRINRNGNVETGPPSRPVVYFPSAEGEEGRVFYQGWDLPAAETTSTNMGGSGGGIRMAMPQERAFEPGIWADVLPDGRVALVDSVGYRIKLLDLEGRVVGTLERPVPPTPVTDAIRTGERDRRLAELESGEGPRMQIVMRGPGGGGGAMDQAAVNEMMKKRLESMTFAEAIPVIENMRADWDGRLWIQRSSGQPGVEGPTDIITADGRYLGSIPADGLRIPAAFGPDGLIARVERDEYDVPTIVVERLPVELRGRES